MEQTKEEIKTGDLIKMIYKGYSMGLILLHKASKDGILTRTKKGYYLLDDKAKTWIKEMRGENENH